jgi:hypothetical protein
MAVGVWLRLLKPHCISAISVTIEYGLWRERGTRDPRPWEQDLPPILCVRLVGPLLFTVRFSFPELTFCAKTGFKGNHGP